MDAAIPHCLAEAVETTCSNGCSAVGALSQAFSAKKMGAILAQAANAGFRARVAITRCASAQLVVNVACPDAEGKVHDPTRSACGSGAGARPVRGRRHGTCLLRGGWFGAGGIATLKQALPVKASRAARLEALGALEEALAAKEMPRVLANHASVGGARVAVCL